MEPDQISSILCLQGKRMLFHLRQPTEILGLLGSTLQEIPSDSHSILCHTMLKIKNEDMKAFSWFRWRQLTPSPLPHIQTRAPKSRSRRIRSSTDPIQVKEGMRMESAEWRGWKITHLKPYGKESTPAPMAALQRLKTETQGDSFFPFLLLWARPVMASISPLPVHPFECSLQLLASLRDFVMNELVLSRKIMRFLGLKNKPSHTASANATNKPADSIPAHNSCTQALHSRLVMVRKIRPEMLLKSADPRYFRGWIGGERRGLYNPRKAPKAIRLPQDATRCSSSALGAAVQEQK